MKNFVKALPKDGEGFKYLSHKFPAVSEAKMKAGIFVGPQIRELLSDTGFTETLTPHERSAWDSFKSVVTGFLGNTKADDYKERVGDMLQAYETVGARMSIKMHFLHGHLDYFPANLGDFSEEQGERFHQDISEMEHRYQGNWSVTMMADFCWSLQRSRATSADTPAHKRKSRKRAFQGE
jgi:hypothetical protein